MDKTEHYPGIRRYVASRIGNPTDAEDLTQGVFLEFYRSTNGDHKSKPENPKAYLFRITRNLIAQYHKSQKRRKSLEIPIDIQTIDRVSHNNYHKNARSQELVEQIGHIIAELPPKARDAVELRLIEGFSPNEAAREAHCSIERFYSRFHKGMKILREEIHSQLL